VDTAMLTWVDQGAPDRDALVGGDRRRRVTLVELRVPTGIAVPD
jgi:hypothetical protein